MLSQIKVGCCGFPVGKKKYFQQFKLVEIQQTFYKLPFIGTVRKWREEAPGDFEFSLKAWQVITHWSSSPTYRKVGLRISTEKENDYGVFRPSEEVFEAWEKTRDVAQALKANVIVFQCPTKFTESTENIENMRYFFTSIDRQDFMFVWEARGKWSNEVITTLCQELDLIHCGNPLEGEMLHKGIGYWRLHGGRNYRHQYTDEELARLRELSGNEAYVLFNNITMHNDALRFKELIGSKG